MKNRKDKNHGWKLPKRIRKKIKMRRGMGYNGRRMRPEKVTWGKNKEHHGKKTGEEEAELVQGEKAST